MGLNHTVSGNIASFRTPSRVPIESLKFHFLPKQADGTPSPENPISIEGWTGFNGYGSGKNIISLSDFQYINNSSNIDLTITDNTMKILCKKDGNDWLKSSQEAKFDIPKAWRGKPIYFGVESITLETKNKDYQRSTIVCEFRDENNTFISDPTVVSVGDGSTVYARKFTIPSNATVMKIYFRIAQNVSSYGVSVGDYIIFNNFYMRYPSDTYGYTKYEGEQIPITFPVAGINKVDPSTIAPETRISVSDGIYSNTGTDTRTFTQLQVQLWKTTGTYIKTAATLNNVTTIGRKALTFNVDTKDCHYIAFKHNGIVADFRVIMPFNLGLGTYTLSVDLLSADPTTVGGFRFKDVQLEVGDTAHAYKVYSPDNTFYGGYIDPVAGEIVAEYEMLTDTWSNWGTAQDQGDGTVLRVKKFTNPVYGNSINNHHTDYCNVTKYVYANENGNPHYYIVGNSYNCRVYLPNNFSTDQIIQVVGKLITPIHIPIPTEDLKAFLDHNNFWSDANDITEVTYAVTESKDILAIQKKAQAFNDYFQGELVFELNGDDAPVDGKWVERVNGWEFTLLGDALYDTANKVYDFSGRSLAFTGTENTNKLSMGHHFRIEWDVYYKRKLCNSSIFFDICSLTSADKAIGIGLLTKSDNSTISLNWKLNGNSSNPWTGSSEQRISPVTIPMDDNFTHFTGFHEIIPGNDNYDRARVKVNDHIIKYTTPIPKADYSGPWQSQNKAISVGAGVYNIANLQRDSTGDSSYYCECKIKSIKIYKYD